MTPQPQPDFDHELDDDALAPAGLGVDGPPPSIDELVAREDVEGLMELAAAHRVGTPHAERSLFDALQCYEAASRLGSAEAEYHVGRAHFAGVGVTADPAEGAKRIRSAAQRGELRAKVFVANLYEMGLVYAADADKADVWYRNVARAAGVEADPESEAYELAMAELGCVRYCLTLVADEALPKKDRAFYLKKAKAMGYAQKLAELRAEKARAQAARDEAARDEAARSEAAQREAAQKTTAVEEPEAAAESAEAPAAEGEEKGEEERDALLGERWTFGWGSLAFLAASFFAAASVAAGGLAWEGSVALARAGRAVPYVEGRHWLVYLATVIALGVLPATAAYRGRVVAMAAALGGALATGGFYLYDAQPLLWDRVAQATAGGLVGFLGLLFFLGLLGGTRARVRPRT